MEKQHYSTGGAIRRMANGGLIGKIASVISSATTDRKPDEAPIGTGAAAQAKTAITTRKQTLDDAERKAMGMAKGGAIRGKGTGTSDDIPIMASDGEFMLKAAAVKKIGVPALEALNAIADGDKKAPAKKKPRGAIRKMAEGGEVKKEDRAVFSLYPQLAGGKRTTYATDNALRSGVVATGPSTFEPALTPAQPAITANGPGVRLNAQQDTRVIGAALPAASVASPSVTATATPLQAPASAPAPAPAPSATNGLGAVRRIGNSFSGQNISGDITVNGQAPRGGAISAQNNAAADALARRYGQTSGFGVATQGGGTVSTLDTSGGYAQDQRELARIDAAKEQQRVGLREQDIYNQSMAGNTTAVRALRGAIKREGEANAAGQKASAAGAVQKLAQDRLGLDRDRFSLEQDGARLDNAGKQRLETLQSTILDPGTKPEARKTAIETYRALTGKTETQNKFTVFSMPDQLVDGQVLRGGQAVIDNTTGQRVQQGGQGGALPPGMVRQIGTSNGRPVYIDQDGKQVIAKGN